MTGQPSDLAGDLELLENQLALSLPEIQPAPEFIQRLGRRLITQPTVVLEQRPRTLAFLVFSLSLFVGAFLVWLMRKIR